MTGVHAAGCCDMGHTRQHAPCQICWLSLSKMCSMEAFLLAGQCALGGPAGVLQLMRAWEATVKESRRGTTPSAETAQPEFRSLY